jgi:hypothetical protein
MMLMSKIFIGAFAVDFLAGKLIEEGTGGDKTKQAARATEGLAIVAGFEKIVGGDYADGINALASAALANKALSPGESLAVQNLLNLAGQQAGIVNLTEGTVLGQAEVALATNVLNEITTVCDAYIAAALPPAASNQAPTSAS